jgi:polysaccharide chain length determinant protein (PEP-CTERM system associated)
MATIAFSLSYEGKDTPQTIQKVANVLASLYLEENIKVRERQTLETFEFLEVEAERMKEQLTAVEARIAKFKEEHINELPEMVQVNIQGLNHIEQNIERFSEQLRAMKEREGYLQTQLASISPGIENQDRIRLNELKVQLVFLESRFTSEYPDVIKIKEEIERLEKAIQSTKSNEEKSSERPDNPAYVTLSSQLASTVAEIDSIYRQIKESERKAVDYRKRIEMTPRVEESYKEMLIERDNAYRKYNDLLQKSMEARVAQGLEKEQKGERFTLIDAARLPEKPYKPNRITILVVGLVLGMAAGGGLAAVRELSDQSIRNPEFLFAATGMPVLASIPILISDGDRLRKRNRRFIGIGGGILLLVIGLVSLHFFVMDLDILWIKLMRRLNRGF